MSKVSIKSKKYPNYLKQISDAPKKLYYKGKWNPAFFNNCLAVVGSRRMSTYGKKIAQKMVFDIASRGITIVSGFMYGIDATAHAAAHEAGGNTIAVMPCGIDVINPPHQKELYKKIQNSGIIISEYSGNFQPQLWTYPKRNRIVVGLSKAVLIIEAGEKSGSLITADIASRYNKKIFAVPGNIDSLNSIGTNKLIKNGAELVTTSKSILEFFGIYESSPLFNPASIKDPILQHLTVQPLNFDQLVEITGNSAYKISSKLTQLELKGLVFEKEGKYYVN